MIEKIKTLLKIKASIPANIVSNHKYDIFYITEGDEWVITNTGYYICENLNKLNLIKAKLSASHIGIRDKIVHFGSLHASLRRNKFSCPHKSNKAILTWFHFIHDDRKIKSFMEVQKCFSLIHTSCNATKKDLIACGVDLEKIVVIPLGIDLRLFNPPSQSQKSAVRDALNIPKDKIIIGSFQKDGLGWGKGLEPKLIKGPDIFVKAVEKISKDHPVFVLLVGPSRGYIKNELIKRNIPFKDIGYFKNFREVAGYYHCLDLYLISSRIEGGPRQVLEAWASGIPIVSTKVGMVQDIAKNGTDILLTEIEDVDDIAEKAKSILTNENLREQLIEQGLKSVTNYSWDKIAKRYYNELYSKLI